MSRKRKEPIEALGPAVNGLDLPLFQPAANDAVTLEEELWQPDEHAQDDSEPVFIEDPVTLIIGQTPEAEATAQLARQCGFIVELADLLTALPLPEADSRDASFHALENFENLVDDCAITRRTFVCIFLENTAACELILTQCLESDAYYIGLDAKGEQKDRIFEALKAAGAPDAELAAIAAPMGLRIGATTPEQRAVAIIAEMLASRAGKLKKLRH